MMMTTADQARSHAGAREATTPNIARLALASVGALAVLAAVVTLVLGMAGVVSLLVPLVCLLITAVSVATLRVLAVRARRARVQQAFAHAMSPMWRVDPVERPTVSALPRPTSLFDAEASDARPLTPMELRTAALATTRRPISQDVGAVGTPIAAPSRADARVAGATAWVPVELPRPTYVHAAKAERDVPAPLDLPEAPRPTTRMPIKTSEAALRATPAEETDVVSAGSSGPATGRINLDDILQRRRA